MTACDTRLSHPAPQREDSARRQPWALEAVLAAAILILVAAGSLTPFAIDPQAPGLKFPGWPTAHIGDIATNVLVYLPVGAALCLLIRRLRLTRSPVIPAAIAATLMSLTLETMQSVIQSRYASWYDVLVNGAGATFGAYLICALAHRARRGLRAAVRRKPAAALSRIAALAIVTYSVAPFDFVATTKALGRTLRTTRIPLLATIQAGRLIPDGPALLNPPAEPISHQEILLASGFIMFGTLVALSSRRRGNRLGAIASAWLLAIIIETLQLFSVHHGFDITDLTRNGLAATIGVAAAAITGRRAASQEIAPGNPTAQRRLPTLAIVWLWSVPILATCLILIREGWQSVWQSAGSLLASAPFAAYFQRPITSALGDMLDPLAIGAVLSLATCALIHRINATTNPRRFATNATLAIAITSAVAAVTATAGPNSAADIILLIMAATVTALAHRRFSSNEPVESAVRTILL